MAYSYSLLSNDEALRAINQQSASNPKTDDINDALHAASEEIQNHLERVVVKLSTTHWIEYHERSRLEDQSSILRVLHWPIDTTWASIEIAEDSSRAYGATTVLTSGTDYRIVNEGDNTSRIERLSGDSEIGWISGYEPIRITIKGGWALADIPRPIRRICKEFLARQYHATVNQEHAYKMVDDARGTVSYFAQVKLTDVQKATLSKYGDWRATTCVRFTEETD